MEEGVLLDIKRGGWPHGFSTTLCIHATDKNAEEKMCTLRPHLQKLFEHGRSLKLGPSAEEGTDANNQLVTVIQWESKELTVSEQQPGVGLDVAKQWEEFNEAVKATR